MSAEKERVMRRVRALEREHFKTSCHPQRCSHGVEECTCYCDECWNLRADCVCPDGPTGPPSGSCPEHGGLL